MIKKHNIIIKRIICFKLKKEILGYIFFVCNDCKKTITKTSSSLNWYEE